MVGCAKRKCRYPRCFLSADDAPDGTFPVIDPFSKRLFLPRSSVIETRALHREGVPSLCCLHLQGRCRQGSRCHQAHADLAVAERLRDIALQEPTCCEMHGARNDSTEIPRNLKILVLFQDEEKRSLETTLAFASVTKGFRLMLKNQNVQDCSLGQPTVVVPSSSLCRLHASSPCCRFGYECKFVHLCREMIVKAQIPKGEDEHKSGATVSEASQQIDIPPALQPLLRSNHKVAMVPAEADVVIGVSPVQFLPPRGSFFNTPIVNGVVSLSSTPKFGTSSALSRSYNSTSLGIVWRHNPYGECSAASSFVET